MNAKPENQLKHEFEDKSEEVIEEPVLQGAEEHSDDDVDPRKGMSDPALIRDTESGKKTINPYG